MLCGVLRRVALLCVRCAFCRAPGVLARPKLFVFLVCVPRGGRGSLAPSPVPWLWPAACLSGVPRGPALVRSASTGPVTLGAPVGFLVAVVPSPTRGSCPYI